MQISRGYHWKKKTVRVNPISCTQYRHGRNNMKYNYKKSVIALAAAALAALTMPVSMMQASAWETGDETAFFDWQYGSCVPKVLDTFIAKLNSFGMEKCDFDGNKTIADTDDFYTLEQNINELYAETGFIRTVKDDDGNILVQGNELTGYPEYDINLDGYATPEDYCLLLQYVQRNFDFELNLGNMSAAITKYTGKDDAHVTVPREVFAKGRIFPVMEIKDGAFQGHEELKSITFEDYIQPVWGFRANNTYQKLPTAGDLAASTELKIGKKVFSGCTNLDTISLPKHVRFADTKPFRGAQYLENNMQEVDGIRYVYDNTATAFVAVDVTRDKVQAINESEHRLAFSEKTTAICSTLTAKLDPEAVTDVYIPASVEYIEENAFANFRNLSTVCYNSYANISSTTKKQVKRYLSAFDNTRFIADAVQPRINEFVNTIRTNAAKNFGAAHANETMPLLVETGKLIAEKAEYSSYYEIHKVDRTEDASETNPIRFSDEFALYPDAPYYYNDLCHGSCNSASAVFLLSDEGEVAYTECVGFAHASSLILDTLGIRNYYCGAPEHALNIVYVGDRWAVFDMAHRSTWNPDDITTDSILDGCWEYMSLGYSRQFELFPVSAERQLKICVPNLFAHEGGEQPADLTVKVWDNLTYAEQQALTGDHLGYRHEYKAPGWFQLENGSYCYMGADGRLLRNAYVADDDNPNIKHWLNEDGFWARSIDTAK